MSRKVKLDPLYIAMVKKEDDIIAREMAKLPVKAVRCRYCNHQTERVAEGKGYYATKCHKCGLVSHHKDDYRKMFRYKIRSHIKYN